MIPLYILGVRYFDPNEHIFDSGNIAKIQESYISVYTCILVCLLVQRVEIKYVAVNVRTETIYSAFPKPKGFFSIEF